MGASTNCEFAEERIKALTESCTALERQIVELLALRNRVRRAGGHEATAKKARWPPVRPPRGGHASFWLMEICRHKRRTLTHTTNEFFDPVVEIWMREH